jgi:hypothetical protein
MTIRDLTNPVAVEAAMDEYDQLGPETFLRKYKSGPAQRYVVKRGESLYDFKAIAAAAHAHQFGQPLDPVEFSGGAATVVPKLRV